jgi:ABC-type transport system involved in multi-copper enzyme maturation permease subunit
MRSTMRGFRAFAGITVFLVFLAGSSLLVYYTLTSSLGSGGNTFEVGRIIFGFISGMEMFLLAALTPTLTAGAIASERQSQTFDMLMATPLTPGTVLRGKLLASMNYIFLLLVAGLPINSLAFLFGGVDSLALLWWLALAVVVMLMLGTIGLLMSTFVRHSGAATALAYLFCMVVFVGAPGILVLGPLFFGIVSASQTQECFALSMALLHPVGSLAAILANVDEFNPAMLLPATLPLYGAVAGFFFLAAEARLSHLTAQRWQRRRWILPPLLIAIAATVYVVAVPVQQLCRQL